MDNGLMELVCGDFTSDGPIAILPGSFNPPTVAHVGLAEAALARVATVVFTLPRVFPHKSYEGVCQAGRLDLLRKLTLHQPRFAVAVTEGGLFVEMAREFGRFRPAGEVFLLCGRDAAERILGWNYPESDPLDRQLEEFQLLVAARHGFFLPPPRLKHRIESLVTEANWDEVSSTAVRVAIENGEPWQHLVPEQIHEQVEAAYKRGSEDSIRNRLQRVEAKGQPKSGSIEAR